MNAPLRWTFVAALMLALASGCTTISGIRRTVVVSQAPSTAAVDSALRDVHRVDDVSFYRGSTSAGRFEQFHYSAGELSGVIEIERGRNGQNTVTIYRVWKNRGPTREQLDETRALMDAVYASLRRRVPDLPPATQIKEELIHPPVR